MSELDNDYGLDDKAENIVPLSRAEKMEKEQRASREAKEEKSEPEELREIPVESCPVTPLGVSGATYFFLKPSGEFHNLAHFHMTTSGLTSLFSGDTSWLIEKFPSFNRKGEEDGGFDSQAASTWLIRTCEKKGIFDQNKQIRRPGVWFDDELGGVLVHCGDTLLRQDNTPCPPGASTRKAIYTAAPPIERPAEKPAGKHEIKFLLSTLRSWKFEYEIGPDLVLGFIGHAAR